MIWLIMVGRGEKSLMEQFKEEIRSVYDFLSRVGQKQTEINRAIDLVTEAHDNLTARQAEFGPLMKQAERLMAANPDVEAVPCGGSDQVLVKLPSGGVTVLPLSHWSEMVVPEPTLFQDAHDRIQAGKPTPADVALKAMARTYLATFDDPDGMKDQ